MTDIVTFKKLMDTITTFDRMRLQQRCFYDQDSIYTLSKLFDGILDGQFTGSTHSFTHRRIYEDNCYFAPSHTFACVYSKNLSLFSLEFFHIRFNTTIQSHSDVLYAIDIIDDKPTFHQMYKYDHELDQITPIQDINECTSSELQQLDPSSPSYEDRLITLSNTLLSSHTFQPMSASCQYTLMSHKQSAVMKLG